MLELGPGDSLYTALAACAHGATRCYLVDDGNYATGEVRGYLEMARDLRQRGFEMPSLRAAKFVDQVLTECNAQYLTDGIASLRGLPSGSVDFIFSNAVLEHVRRDQLPALLAETRRVLKANGRCCHRVDLQDHLGGALNNLRFSDAVWESDGMAHSGFYTNRVRYRELLGLFENAGFSVEVRRELRWSALPTRREKLAERFRALPEDDLLVYGFDAVLHPR
jgi:SAM-dependent methyltransferase